nr:hypothetical protein [Tanacetum cinerariifolium]
EAAAGGGVNGGDGAGDVDGEEVVMWHRGLVAVGVGDGARCWWLLCRQRRLGDGGSGGGSGGAGSGGGGAWGSVT